MSKITTYDFALSCFRFRSDPLIRGKANLGDISRIPIAAYLNSSFVNVRQDYIINYSRKDLTWETTDLSCSMYTEVLTSHFKKVSMILEPMHETDIPNTYELYTNIIDSFIGGDKFIRVLGDPPWLQEVISVKCNCGLEMTYIACIGYERYDQIGSFSVNPFFFGEMGLYCFLCITCKQCSIIPQST